MTETEAAEAEVRRVRAARHASLRSCDWVIADAVLRATGSPLASAVTPAA